MQSKNLFGVVFAIASVVSLRASFDALHAQVAVGAGTHAPLRPLRRPSPPQRPLFPELILHVGPSPEAARAGDLDGDGDLDLAVPNSFGATVSILLGNGGGLLDFGAVLGTGDSPRHVALGDLDADGDLDLAVACAAAGVLVFEGTGAGTFDARTNHVTGGAPWWVEFAHLDSDSDLDMVVANAGSNTIAVLLGNGDTTFQTPVSYTAGAGPSSIGVGDLDGDTDLDLVVGNGGGQRVSVLLGNGDGTFGTQQIFDCGDAPRSVALGDLNGDGDLDVAVANATQGKVSVLLGNGDGTLGADVGYVTNGFPSFVAIGDLDGDLDLDLAVANSGTHAPALLVLRNQGTGVFASLQSYSATAPGSGVALGDFDDDGRLDVAISGYYGSAQHDPGHVTIVRGTAGGSLESLLASPAAAEKGELADLDGDGDLDLASVFHSDGFVRISLGNGAGGFTPGASYPVGPSPIEVTTGTIDADLDLDLVVTNSTSNPGVISVLLGNGDGTFTAAPNVTVDPVPYSTALGDIDHDGDADLASVTREGPQGRLSILLGNGDGTFTPHSSNFAIVSSALLVRLVDLNGDTHLDVLGVAAFHLNPVTVRLGDGSGNFGPAVQYGGSGLFASYCATTGDLNGDGALDVAIGGANGGFVVLLGNGDGTFDANLEYYLPSSALHQAIAIGDVDLDGKADLVLRGYGWAVVRGRGDGTFHAPRHYLSLAGASSLGLGDLDGDGDLDIVGGTASSAFTSLNRTIP